MATADRGAFGSPGNGQGVIPLPQWIVDYWIEWAMAGLAGMLGLGYRKLSKRLKTANQESDALRQGMRALLRDRLIQQYNYYTDKGRWPIYARDSMLDMYKQYKALGGNGAITSIMQDLEELPTEKHACEG